MRIYPFFNWLCTSLRKKSFNRNVLGHFSKSNGPIFQKVHREWNIRDATDVNTWIYCILPKFYRIFTSPLFGGEIYTGNLLWTKYPLTFQFLDVVKKTISFRLDWKYLPSSNSDMWIFIKKLEKNIFLNSISIFCHEIVHALGLSTWLS